MSTGLSDDELRSCCESHQKLGLFPPASCVEMLIFHCIAGPPVPCDIRAVS